MAKLGKKFIAALAFAIAPGGGTHATILTFDQIRELGNVVPTISGRVVPQDYGDRVTGSPMDVSGGQFTYGNRGEGFTPNVVTDYFTGAATPINPGVSLWVDSYGDLVNVMLGNQNSGSLNIRFTADTGFEVELYSFDLGGWPNTDYTIEAVRVLDGGSTIFSQSNVLVAGDFVGPRRTSFEFATPLSGSELLLQVDYGNLHGNQQDNIGIDNVRFAQNPRPGAAPVPVREPSTPLLVGFALVSMVLSGWQRRRHFAVRSRSRRS